MGVCGLRYKLVFLAFCHFCLLGPQAKMVKTPTCHLNTSNAVHQVNISHLKCNQETDWTWSGSPPTGCICPKILPVLIKADWAVFIQSIRPSNQSLRRLESLIYPMTISMSILFTIFLERLSDYIFIPLELPCSILGTVRLFILSGRRLICWCR